MEHKPQTESRTLENFLIEKFIKGVFDLQRFDRILFHVDHLTEKEAEEYESYKKEYHTIGYQELIDAKSNVWLFPEFLKDLGKIVMLVKYESYTDEKFYNVIFTKDFFPKS